VLVSKPEGKPHLEDMHVDVRIILKWICDVMTFIHQAQDKVQRQALTNAAMNLLVLQDDEISVSSQAASGV
jgi:hypothetical protein